MFAFLLSGCAGSSVGTNPQFDPQPQAEVSHFTPPESPVFEGFAAPEPQIETLPNPPQFTVSEPPPEPDYRPVPVSHRPPPEEPFRRPVAVSHRPPPPEEPFRRPVAVSHRPLPYELFLRRPVAVSENRPPLNPCFNRDTDACNRANIPGLIPLHNLISAHVSARMARGETIPKLGVIIDGSDLPSSHGWNHGYWASTTARTMSLPELVDWIDYSKIARYNKVFATLNERGYTRPIVNIPAYGVLRLSTDDPAGGFNYKTLRDVNALLVLPTGNFAGEAQPRAGKGIYEAHEMTGSVLLATGWLVSHLDYESRKWPLIDENGFHKGWTTDEAFRSSANRCGDAMDFCVTVPYEFFTGVNESNYFSSILGMSFASPRVAGVLVNLRYVWPHLTNRQLIRLVCETAVDIGEPGNDPVWGCGLLSVSAIWQPTGELVSDPVAEFSLPVASGQMSVSGASFSEPVTVTGYENNELKRDYEVAVAASDSGTSVRIDPAVSWNSLNSILRFRKDGANSLPLANGRGSATHLFKDTFLFLKGAENFYGALGLLHKSGFSIAFERETDSFFGSVGSGSYKFGDTNKIVASFDRDFQIGKTYNAGLKLAAAYGKMEPDISLVKSASGTAQTAQVSIGRKKNNFETRLEMSYSTGLKGEISVQNTNYKLKPRSEKGVVIRMRLAI